MSSDTSASRSEREVRQTEQPGLSYNDVDVTSTSGYRPMIAVASLAIITFFLFGGGLPIYWGESQGYTLFTYTVVVWAISIIVLGFGYEYWVEKNESESQTARVTTVQREGDGR